MRREYVSMEWCEECGRMTQHRVKVFELVPPLQPLPIFVLMLVKCLRCGRVDILSTPREVVEDDEPRAPP